MCDQAYEMSQRHIRFDVNELARCAIEAVGATSCINIEKYPDGMYNKAMLLTMDNGHQVVAKIPNPNAGAPHFTTACEVATMDFVSLSSWLKILSINEYYIGAQRSGNASPQGSCMELSS